MSEPRPPVRLVEVPGPPRLCVEGVLVSPAVAAYLLLGAAQVHLRERAPRLREGRELLATLAALERAAAAHARRTALEREDADAPSAAVPPSPQCTTDEAAAILRLSRRRVQELLVAGELAGRRVGRAWLVDRESVMLWQDERNAA